jgi:hypothetical protein
MWAPENLGQGSFLYHKKWNYVSLKSSLTMEVSGHCFFTGLAGIHPPLGPLYTWARSRDYEVVRVQKKVFKGRPKTPPESCSVVTDPRVYCDAICDRAPQPYATTMEFLFMRVLTHDKIRRNQWLWAFGMSWSPSFVLSLPPRGGFWK